MKLKLEPEADKHYYKLTVDPNKWQEYSLLTKVLQQS